MRPPLNRRAVRVLRVARDIVGVQGSRLAAATYLGDAERQLLRPVLRQWSVRWAVVWLSPMRYAVFPLGFAAAVTCLLAPAAVVAIPATRDLTGVGQLLASTTYLSVFGVVSATVFRLLRITILARLGWLGAGFCVLSTLALAVWMDSPWSATRYGLVAGLVGALAILAGVQAANLLGTYVWFATMHRPLGELQPRTATAARLWFLLHDLAAIGGRWRQPAARRELLWKIGRTGFWLETRLRLAMWMAGHRGHGYEVAARHYRRTASYVQALAWQVMNAGNQAAFEGIRKDLTEVTVAVARGDWERLPPLGEHSRVSRLVTVGRRLIAPTVLAIAAVSLPYLPGVAEKGPALTSIQVGLFVTAALTLTSLDQFSRDRILHAFDESHRRPT